jgi:Flp pilus assembly protein TadD
MPFLLAIEWKYLAERFPEDVSVRYNAGLWMLDAHRYQDAVAYMRLATESRRLPRTVRGMAFESLGVALMNSGHSAEAEAPLRAALEQAPPDLRAYCSLTEVYKQSGRFEEAARARAHCPGGAGSIPLHP